MRASCRITADLIANNGGTLPAGIPLSGTSPGTLTFQGNVTLGATATTIENIDGALQIPGGPGTYNKIVVTGANNVFAVNGALLPALRNIPGGNNNYVAPIGTMFPMITALNGATITGQFAGFTQPTTGLAANSRLDIVYLPNSITLNVTPLNFANLATNMNANQQGVAQAVDRIRPKPNIQGLSVEQPLFNALYDEDNSGDDAGALASLSGQGHAANPHAVLATFGGFSDTISHRTALTAFGLGDVQASVSPKIAFGSGKGVNVAADSAPFSFGLLGGPASAWAGWSEGFGQWSRTGDAGGLPGSHSDTGGFALGADHAVEHDLRAGGALGFTRTTTTSAGAQSASNTYAAALYASWTPGAWMVNGQVAGGPTTGGSSRTVVFPGESSSLAQGSVSGWGALVAGETGYRFDALGGTVEPYAGLTAETLHQAAFTESGAFGLNFPAQTFRKVTSALGTRVAKRFQLADVTLAPQGSLAWTHDLRDNSLTTQASLFDAPFQITAADPGRDAAAIGLDLAAWQRENLRLFLSYNAEFRDNAISQGVTGGLAIIW